MASRQVTRAFQRFSRKLNKASYPKGLTAGGQLIQRYEPFEPRGRTWPNPGKLEAARRLARLEG